MINRFCCLLFLFLAACASSTPQTDQLLAHAPTLPQKVVIPDVPFVEQKAGFCGPATLAMALQWSGESVTMEELAPQVYTPGMEGSLQSDMISSARRHGKIAIPVSGLEDLLQEVAAGHPVVVFENLAVSWWPQWHYAIVFGFDLSKQTVRMHSGPEANKNWELRRFERSWKLGDYWGLVVLRPGEIAATGGEWAHLKATAALEQIGSLSAAEKSYEKILHVWPKSLGARIGLANVAFSQRRLAEAYRELLQATREHPDSETARKNLAVVKSALEKSETL